MSDETERNKLQLYYEIEREIYLNFYDKMNPMKDEISSAIDFKIREDILRRVFWSLRGVYDTTRVVKLFWKEHYRKELNYKR